MNYKNLQIGIEKIIQNAVFLNWHFCRASSIKKSKYCCYPPFHPHIFCRFKTFVTHPPNINKLDTVVTPPLSSNPDTPKRKIWNVHLEDREDIEVWRTIVKNTMA